MKLNNYLRFITKVAPGKIPSDIWEFWFIARGIHEQAVTWYNNHPPTERRAMQEKYLSAKRGAIFVAWEDPPFPRANTIILSPKLNSGEHAVGCYEITKDDKFLKLGDYWGTVNIAPDVVVNWIEIYRQFALLPYPQRPRVDISVAESPPRGEGKKTIPSTFVVKWRKISTQPVNHLSSSIDVEWSHRWIVRAHLRQLKDGRIVPVREHVKGPGDKPLVLKTPVNELVR